MELKPETWQAAFDFLGRNLDRLSEQEREIQQEIPDLKRRVDAAKARLEQIRSKGKTKQHYRSYGCSTSN